MATLGSRLHFRRLTHAAHPVIRPLLGLCAMATTACGDALVDSEFRGDAPLWQIFGEVEANDRTAVPPSNLRVALFWSPRGPREMSFDRYAEQAATSIPVSVPSYFVLNIFDSPGPEYMVAAPPDPPPRTPPPPPPGPTTPYAIGRLVAYSDDNGNGLRDADESLQSVLRDAVFLYAPTDIPAGQSPVNGVLAAGFHRSAVPALCGLPVPGPQTPGDCGVPLGEPCDKDSDCGAAGVCIENLPAPWPGGACAVAEPPPSGCRPSAGAYYLAPMLKPGATAAYWLKSCTQDIDCLRAEPVRRSAYLCDPGWHACLPPNPNLLFVGMSPLMAIPVCLGP
jgi:hypothetical protein